MDVYRRNTFMHYSFCCIPCIPICSVELLAFPFLLPISASSYLYTGHSCDLISSLSNPVLSPSFVWCGCLSHYSIFVHFSGDTAMTVTHFLHDYNPSIFPATFSTASFNLNDSLTTVSFSSSPHSAMKVAVSDTKPTNKASAM